MSIRSNFHASRIDAIRTRGPVIKIGKFCQDPKAAIMDAIKAMHNEGIMDMKGNSPKLL